MIMSQVNNSSPVNEEAPKNNILASELKSEANDGSTTTINSTTYSKHPDGSDYDEEAPKNNILASELKSEATDGSTTTISSTTYSKYPEGSE